MRDLEQRGCLAGSIVGIERSCLERGRSTVSRARPKTSRSRSSSRGPQRRRRRRPNVRSRSLSVAEERERAGAGSAPAGTSSGDDGVAELGLVGDADGRRGVQPRDAAQPDAGQGRQGRHRRGQRRGRRRRRSRRDRCRRGSVGAVMGSSTATARLAGMRPVSVRIMHPEPGPTAGPLERWVADARARVARAPPRRASPRRARTMSAIVGGPPDDLPFGRAAPGAGPCRSRSGRARRPRLRRDPAGDGGGPPRRSWPRRRPRTGVALANNRYSADVVAIARRGGPRRRPRPAGRQRPAALARGGRRLRGAATCAGDGGSRSTSTARSTCVLLGSDRRGRRRASTSRRLRPRSRRPGRRRRPARRAARRRPDVGRRILAWLERPRPPRGSGRCVEERGLRAASRSPRGRRDATRSRDLGRARRAARAGRAGVAGRRTSPGSATRRSSTRGSSSPTGWARTRRPGRPPRIGSPRTCCSPDRDRRPVAPRADRVGRRRRRSRSCSAATRSSGRASGWWSAGRRAGSPDGRDARACAATRPGPRRGRRGRGARGADPRRDRPRRPDDVRPLHGPRALRPGRRLLPGGGRATGPRGRLPDRARGPPDLRGRAGSRAVADAWDRLGRPDPFVLREYGAGTGTLALAILDGLARGAARSRVGDPLRTDRGGAAPARGHRRPARGGRSRCEPRGARVAGRGRSTGSSSPTRSSTRSRRIGSVQRAGVLREVMVGSRDGAFVDVEADPSTPALAAPPRRRTASPSPTASARRSASRSTRGSARAAAGLERGLLLLIDYGYAAAELYDPVRRRDGTLRAYLRHRVHDDPVPPRRAPGPHRARRCHRGRASRRARPA